MPLDIRLNQFLREHGTAYLVILNKVDKLKQSEIASAQKKVKEYFPELITNENLFLFSAVKGIGKKEIVHILTRLLLTK